VPFHALAGWTSVCTWNPSGSPRATASSLLSAEDCHSSSRANKCFWCFWKTVLSEHRPVNSRLAKAEVADETEREQANCCNQF